MTTEEKFIAAVNVIRNLPKNGAYQPSHDLKLRFYAYFKQATDGPCSIPKPAFWDIIGRSKYDAWKKLGNMSKTEAMENYVEELKKIVETMSYNDNVGMFLGSLGNFYDNVPVEDIEMLLGPVIERMRSQPGSPLHNSPLGSRETSPTRVPRHLVNKANVSSFETSPLSSLSPSPQPPDTDDEDEEFIDTVETTPHTSRKVFKSASTSDAPPVKNQEIIENGKEKSDKNCVKMNGYVTNGPSRNGIQNGNMNGKISEDEDQYGKTKPRERESPNCARRRVAKVNGGPKTVSNAHVTDLSEPLRQAVLHLQKDLDRITSRVRSLEVAMLSQPQFFHEVELCKACEEKLGPATGDVHASVQRVVVSKTVLVTLKNLQIPWIEWEIPKEVITISVEFNYYLMLVSGRFGSFTFREKKAFPGDITLNTYFYHRLAVGCSLVDEILAKEESDKLNLVGCLIGML